MKQLALNTCRCGALTPRPLCYFCVRSAWQTRPVCNTQMAQGDLCARRLGHRYEHRSAYALENARRMATGRYLRKWIAA